ncbi:COQ7 protein [Scleroderma citrinum]
MLSCLRGRVRYVSTTLTPSARASETYTNPSSTPEPAVSTSPQNIAPEQRRILEAALRVDQAGELAANWIYRGQMVILGSHPKVGPLIQTMWDQEKHHLAVMDKLRIQHRVRPTILSDIAKTAGFGLGVATALMGKEAAMACTEAVETVIGEHYDDQLKDIETLSSSHPSVRILSTIIQEFRDDELEHLNTAVNHHSQRAPAHALLSTVVSCGCKMAIELCKRF